LQALTERPYASEGRLQGPLVDYPVSLAGEKVDETPPLSIPIPFRSFGASDPALACRIAARGQKCQNVLLYSIWRSRLPYAHRFDL
jgi:hypothetical protein